MRRSSPSLQFLTATTSAASSRTAMTVTPRYRGGGRRQWQRGLSNHQTTGRTEHPASGESNLHTVQDADLRFREGDGGNSSHQTRSQPPAFNGRHPYNHSQSFRQPLPHNQNRQYPPSEYPRPTFNGGRPYNQNPSFRFRQPAPYHQTQQFSQQQHYNQNQSIYRPPLNVQGQQSYQQLQQYPNQSFHQPPPYYQNSPRGAAQQRAPRPPKALIYRNWESSKTKLPPDCKRFVILSYNLLADYLALNHKAKLYFHVPHYMLEWNWRKKNIIFELGLWSADIMCLQEVDRFQDLEEELKLRGYSGIWKMRTGDPVDGCAIFWRTSRFKLLHEESIEFSKLGLRDNVAQICVLGLVDEHSTEDVTSPQPIPGCLNKIILCNTHVLYNPKRGDIKLGQVRVLLEKAHSVSEIWDNAPVVLCGDFNCTPKSPLYNFISEQQLSLSGLDRDKVSGQTSAEIHEPRMNYRNNGDEPANKSIQAPLKVNPSNEHESISPSTENVHIVDNSNQNKLMAALMDESDESSSCTNVQHASQDRELNHDLKERDRPIIGNLTSNETGFPSSFSSDMIEDTSYSQEAGGFPLDLRIDARDNLTLRVSHSEDASFAAVHEIRPDDCQLFVDKSLDDCPSSGGLLKPKEFGSIESLDSKDETTGDRLDPESLDSYNSSVSICQKDNSENTEFSSDSVDEKLRSWSLNDPDESTLGDAGPFEFEDNSTFLAALHNVADSNLPQDDVSLDESSSAFEHGPMEERKAYYDPSLWTPMEIATATGHEDCLNLEHKLKLKSTYTEVEEISGTRDENGEPCVTSYNRRFMGTVDYIWRSEGLQTLRVLAPIPKVAMQWTQGFPTKKWGSDHIALVSELAFTRVETNQEAES